MVKRGIGMREHFDDRLEYNEDEMLVDEETAAVTAENVEETESDELGIEIIDLYGRDRIVKNVSEKKAAIKNSSEEKVKEPAEKFNPVKELFSFLTSFVVAVVIAMLVQRFIIINANIPSGSMENTIMTGDRVIGNRLAYLFGEPKRGDIVIFKYPDDESQLFVKRVIGLPGEEIVINDAKVYIDGVLLEEEYLKDEWIVDNGLYTYVVPEDCYFVMGDNRNNSKDSRYWINTYVQDDQLLGEAVFCYWPFEDFGKLE